MLGHAELLIRYYFGRFMPVLPFSRDIGLRIPANAHVRTYLHTLCPRMSLVMLNSLE